MLSLRNSFNINNFTFKTIFCKKVSNYAPRRAVLYVPGDSEKKISKAYGINPDCIAMDCEDGVAVNKKLIARETIHKFLQKGKPSGVTSDLAVRINSVDSGLCEEDLAAILTAKYLPDSILLPKVCTIEHLKWFTVNIKKYFVTDKKLNLIILIESAKSVINLVSLCKYAEENASNYVLTSLIFGSDDFCASIGAIRTEDQTEILYARQKLVLVAKAFNLQAIDMVYINYKDLNGLRKQCEQGMRMGYTGKQVIHPDQVPIVHSAFLPTEDQKNWAIKLLEAFTHHQKSGIGAFTFEGHMIDMPTIKIAQNIVNLLKQAKDKK